MDYFNLSTLIHELSEKISNIETILQEIEYEIGRLKKVQPFKMQGVIIYFCLKIYLFCLFLMRDITRIFIYLINLASTGMQYCQSADDKIVRQGI